MNIAPMNYNLSPKMTEAKSNSMKNSQPAFKAAQVNLNLAKEGSEALKPGIFKAYQKVLNLIAKNKEFKAAAQNAPDTVGVNAKITNDGQLLLSISDAKKADDFAKNETYKIGPACKDKEDVMSHHASNFLRTELAHRTV